MKKITLIIAIVLFVAFTNAQYSKPIVVKPAQNNELVALQKTNAILKMSLNELKVIVAMQNSKTDSLFIMLNTSINKNLENQSNINSSIELLKSQTSNISDAFILRKYIAIIMIIGFIAVFLMFWFLFSRKLKLIHTKMRENEEKLILTLNSENELLKKEMSELKLEFDKQIRDFNLNLYRQNADLKDNLTSQINDSKAIIEEVKSQFEKNIDTINEQIINNDKIINDKIIFIQNSVEKQMEGVKEKKQGLKPKK